MKLTSVIQLHASRPRLRCRIVRQWDAIGQGAGGDHGIHETPEGRRVWADGIWHGGIALGAGDKGPVGHRRLCAERSRR